MFKIFLMILVCLFFLTNVRITCHVGGGWNSCWRDCYLVQAWERMAFRASPKVQAGKIKPMYFSKSVLPLNPLFIIDLKYVSVCCCLVAKSCPVFCDPMDCSPPGSSVQGIFQARILDPWDLPNPGIEPKSCVSCTCRQVLYH